VLLIEILVEPFDSDYQALPNVPLKFGVPPHAAERSQKQLENSSNSSAVAPAASHTNLSALIMALCAFKMRFKPKHRV